MRLTKLPSQSYYISPVQSNESEFDDSDADRNVNFDSSSSNSSDSAKELGESKGEVEDPEGKKKRNRCPEKWVAKKIQLMRNSAKAYVLRSKSKTIFCKKNALSLRGKMQIRLQ